MRATSSVGGMARTNVTHALADALKLTGLSEAWVRHKPRLLSDNRPGWIRNELPILYSNQQLSSLTPAWPVLQKAHSGHHQ